VPSSSSKRNGRKILLRGKNNTDNPDPELAIELGFEVDYDDWLEAEVLFEIEDNGRRHFQELDEGSIGVNLGDWEMKVGRINVPFGAFYSHFGSGPLLEFGKVRGDAVVMEYTFMDSFELATYIFDSKVDRRENHNEVDWGVNLQHVSEDESIHVGIGYLSDLGESKEEFLLDFNNNFLRRVPAWNVYALIGLPSVEITAEVLGAAKTFREFPLNANQPFVYNLEVAYFPIEAVQIATRIELSEELMDEPEWQYGVSTTWAIFNNLTVTADYLYGRYKKQFVFDDFNNAQTAHHFTGLKLTWGF